MIVFSRDPLRSSVEAATGGKVTVLYDDRGYPSYMVRFPEFRASAIEPKYNPLPAFSWGADRKREVFIAQYLCIVVDDRAVSIPGVPPTNQISFDEARLACQRKGSGWHLISNWEWAAIAQWSILHATQPTGNMAGGHSNDRTEEAGIVVSPTDKRTLTGSGPPSWRHDGSVCGIDDLAGNLSQWVDGVKLVNGEILLNPENSDKNESSWTKTNVAFCGVPINLGIKGMETQLSQDKEYQKNTSGFDYTPLLTDSPPATFSKVKEQLELGAIKSWQPANVAPPRGGALINPTGERMLIRGGNRNGCNDLTGTGIYSVHLGYPRSYKGELVGFRCAYFE